MVGSFDVFVATALVVLVACFAAMTSAGANMILVLSDRGEFVLVTMARLTLQLNCGGVNFELPLVGL